MDSEVTTDGFSKVPLFLKKLAKKTSTKVPAEGKTGAASSSQGEKKMLDKIRSYQDAPFIEALIGQQEDKFSNSSSQDTARPSAPTAASSHTGQPPAFADVNADDRVVDEGTLCWNLLSSRLFFDAKMSDEINKFIKASYSENIIKHEDPSLRGSSYTHGLQSWKASTLYTCDESPLPLNLNELWAFEVDFEYSC